MRRYLLCALLLLAPFVVAADEVAETTAKANYELIEIDPSNIESDPTVSELIEPYRKEVEKMRAPIGYATETMHFGNKETPLGCWMTDVMREAASRELDTTVDVAFTNCGGIRAPLPEGAISEETILNIMPFDNSIVVFKVNGKELTELAQTFAGSFGYFPISGMTIDADVAGKLLEFKVGGETVDPNKDYYVATSDYLAGSMDSIQKYMPARNTKVLIRDEMIRAVKELSDEGKKLSPPEDSWRYRYDGKRVETMIR